MTTLEEIRRQLAVIQAELAEVAAAIDGLEAAPAAVGGLQRGGWPPTVRFSDTEPLRQAFTEMMRRLGIEHVQPIGAEALQQMMLREGVKPEENLFSRGIIEMREEYPGELLLLGRERSRQTLRHRAGFGPYTSLVRPRRMSP